MSAAPDTSRPCRPTDYGFAYELILAGPPTQEFGRRAAHRVLDTEDAPTALFAGSNSLTLGVLCALSERGLRAPDDFAVAAFDEADWMSLVLRQAARGVAAGV